jgi:hypothetical protein
MKDTSLSLEEALEKLLAEMPHFGQVIVDWNQGLSGLVGAEDWISTVANEEDMLFDIVEYLCTGCRTISGVDG